MLIIISAGRLYAQVIPPMQPEQDACNALVLCGGYFYTPFSYSGYGHIIEEFQGPQINGAGCHGENNSVWFRLDAVTSGKLIFTIKPDTPTDDYDFTVWDGTNANCLFLSGYSYQRLRCNGNTGFGTDGTLGLSDTAAPTRIEGGAIAQGMLKALDITAGNFYYILVDNFSGSTSGFSIDFAGSTAVFKGDGNPPQYAATAEDTCRNSIRLNVTMKTPVQCASIAADGSDFEIDPPIANVIAASGENCVGNLGYSSKINLLFNIPLPVGTYTLKAKRGTDNNSLLNLCGTEQLPGNSIPFIVDSTSLEPNPKFTATTNDDLCHNTKKLNIFLNKQILCGSVAPDGSDFVLLPAVANVIAATGVNCTGSTGYSTKINIAFDKNLPAGTYTLQAKKGSDNNTLLDRCGNEQLLTDKITFTIDNAGVEPPPKYAGVVTNTNCDYNLKLKINSSKQLQCNSIAVDGSDFELVPAVANIIAATGTDCSGNLGISSQIEITFSAKLPVGKYTIKAKKGADHNSLIDLCGEEQPEGDSINFTIISTAPKYARTIIDSCKTNRKLTVKMSRPVLCTSVAADGSDFEITPPLADITTAAAVSNCSGDPGYTNDIILTFNKSLPIGTFTLKPKRGTDNNILTDSCNNEQELTDHIEFYIDDPAFKVNAGRDTIICSGSSVVLQGAITGGSGTIEWTPATGLTNPGILHPVVSPGQTTDYILSVIPNRSGIGCVIKDTVHIQVLQQINLLSGDTTICKEGEVQVKLEGDSLYKYKWTPANGVSDPFTRNPLIRPDSSRTYTVTSSYPGCSDSSASLYIKVLKGFTILNEDTSICKGNSVALSFYGDNEYSYQWQPAGNFAGSVVTPVATTTYSLTASYPGCTDSTQSITIKVLQPFELLTRDSFICKGNSITLLATGDNSFDYRWSPATHLSNPAILSPVATPDTITVFILTASHPGCMNVSKSVTIGVEPVPVIATLSPTNVCYGSTIKMNPVITPASYTNYRYQWSPTSSFSQSTIANPFYTPGIGNNTALLIVSTTHGCADTLSQVFTVNPLPVVNAGPDMFVQPGNTIQLQGSVNSNATNFQWMPDININNTKTLQPLVSPVTNQFYLLRAISTEGCIAYDTVWVKMINNLYIPSAFSPNGDGLNDVWNISGLQSYSKCTVKIYNRWGEPVFESEGYAKPWDGRFKGETQPIGVFHYIIDLHLADRNPYIGSITLIR